MMYGYEFGYWGMIIGTIFTLVLLVGLVWFVVWAIRRTGGNVIRPYASGGSVGSPAARQLLDQRYGRGEITREQYQQMKQDLDGR